MARSDRARLVWAALAILCPSSAAAETLKLDVSAAVARARERAPEAVVARATIGEARAGRVGADVLFTENPEVQIGAGRRYGEPQSLAIQGQVTQPLELGRRSARKQAVDAEVAHAEAAGEAALRELAYEVEVAFYEARHAELVQDLARRTEGISKSAAEAAERRRKAGDLTDLDVNLAKLAVGRAYSAVAAAQSARFDAYSRLGVLVGVGGDDSLELVGDLRPSKVTLETLQRSVGTRADIKAATAEVAEARAEGALATANGRPDLGVWLGYQIDEGDSIVLAGVTFTLPAWNRQQGAKAQAKAKEVRAAQEGAVLATTAQRQVADLYGALSDAEASVVIFEDQILPLLDDSEALLLKSVEAGQIAISEYLVGRQQTLDARREHLDRLLLFAKAAAKARYVAGVTP